MWTRRESALVSAGLFVFLIVLSITGGTARGAGESLSGQGSSLIAPLLTAWGGDFTPKTGTTIAYYANGSSAGVAAITARVVDFGASDAPLTPDQFAAAKGVVQIPWALSATAIS